MFVDIDENLVLWSPILIPYLFLMEGDEIKCSLRQTVAAVRERLRIQKISIHPLDPAGLPADIPRCAYVTGPVVGPDAHAITRLESA